MLVLTRKPGERIIIGENKDIIITVCAINKGYSVRIGIDAEKDVPILREEVLDKLECQPVDIYHNPF